MPLYALGDAEPDIRPDDRQPTDHEVPEGRVADAVGSSLRRARRFRAELRRIDGGSI